MPAMPLTPGAKSERIALGAAARDARRGSRVRLTHLTIVPARFLTGGGVEGAPPFLRDKCGSDSGLVIAARAPLSGSLRWPRFGCKYPCGKASNVTASLQALSGTWKSVGCDGPPSGPRETLFNVRNRFRQFGLGDISGVRFTSRAGKRSRAPRKQCPKTRWGGSRRFGGILVELVARGIRSPFGAAPPFGTEMKCYTADTQDSCWFCWIVGGLTAKLRVVAWKSPTAAHLAAAEICVLSRNRTTNTGPSGTVSKYRASADFPTEFGAFVKSGVNPLKR